MVSTLSSDRGLIQKVLRVDVLKRLYYKILKLQVRTFRKRSAVRQSPATEGRIPEKHRGKKKLAGKKKKSPWWEADQSNIQMSGMDASEAILVKKAIFAAKGVFP